MLFVSTKCGHNRLFFCHLDFMILCIKFILFVINFFNPILQGQWELVAQYFSQNLNFNVGQSKLSTSIFSRENLYLYKVHT